MSEPKNTNKKQTKSETIPQWKANFNELMPVLEDSIRKLKSMKDEYHAYKRELGIE